MTVYAPDPARLVLHVTNYVPLQTPYNYHDLADFQMVSHPLFGG